MGIQLRELAEGRRSIEVAIPEVDGMIKATYKIAAVTEASFSSSARVATLLAGWLDSWDLMNGDEPYAITEENLQALPQRVLILVFDAILEDTRSRPTKRPGSFSTG